MDKLLEAGDVISSKKFAEAVRLQGTVYVGLSGNADDPSRGEALFVVIMSSPPRSSWKR